jgi:hypothetical protein
MFVSRDGPNSIVDGKGADADRALVMPPSRRCVSLMMLGHPPFIYLIFIAHEPTLAFGFETDLAIVLAIDRAVSAFVPGKVAAWGSVYLRASSLEC